MNILDLPTEVITQLLSYLKGFELAKLSQTCTAFRDITDIDLLWQKTCSREYRCKSLSGWTLSYRELYGKVLYKYGYLLGLWKDTTSCYGGLVHVWYDHGCIRADEYIPTKDVREPLWKKEIFTINMSEAGEIQTTWNPGCGLERQPCDLINKPDKRSDTKTTVINKRWKKDFQPDKATEQKEMVEFLEACSIQGTHPELCMFKWQAHKKLKYSQTLQSLHLSSTRPEEPYLPSPGLYKGVYGGHGTELMCLSYDLDKKKAFTRKISGDPNVPAGEISITADLSHPLVLTKEEQESIERLRSVEVWEGPVLKGEGLDQSMPSKQPFVIPREVSPEDEFLLPKHCVARFKGTATVSPTGYQYPQQIPAHFIVFDENLFGGLWLDLYSFGTFCKVQDKFPGEIDATELS